MGESSRELDKLVSTQRMAQHSANELLKKWEGSDRNHLLLINHIMELRRSDTITSRDLRSMASVFLCMFGLA